MSRLSTLDAKSCLLRLLLSASLLAGVASCKSESSESIPANRLASNDFEAVEGWGVNSSSITTAKAHSGRYSVKVDKESEFSVGYRNTLLRMSNTKISKLHVHGWALMTGAKAKAVIVVQISEPGKPGPPTYWQALDIKGELKTLNHWTEIEKNFDLPANLAPNQEIQVYMWRTSPDDATYLDDLELTKG